jgi:hypothetical protein
LAGDRWAGSGPETLPREELPPFPPGIAGGVFASSRMPAHSP